MLIQSGDFGALYGKHYAPVEIRLGAPVDLVPQSRF